MSKHQVQCVFASNFIGNEKRIEMKRRSRGENKKKINKYKSLCWAEIDEIAGLAGIEIRVPMHTHIAYAGFEQPSKREFPQMWTFFVCCERTLCVRVEKSYKKKRFFFSTLFFFFSQSIVLVLGYLSFPFWVCALLLCELWCHWNWMVFLILFRCVLLHSTHDADAEKRNGTEMKRRRKKKTTTNK